MLKIRLIQSRKSLAYALMLSDWCDLELKWILVKFYPVPVWYPDLTCEILNVWCEFWVEVAISLLPRSEFAYCQKELSPSPVKYNCITCRRCTVLSNRTRCYIALWLHQVNEYFAQTFCRRQFLEGFLRNGKFILFVHFIFSFIIWYEKKWKWDLKWVKRHKWSPAS